MDPSSLEVPIEKLRWSCDPKSFNFLRTDELSPLEEFIGQDRAIRAIGFGLSIDRPGYNIFVAGISGTGKASIVKAHLESLLHKQNAAGDRRPPSDWCYLFNFLDADKPVLAELPAGRGRLFKQRMEHLRDEVRREVQQAFAGEEYDARRKTIAREVENAQQAIFRQLEIAARAEGFAVQFSNAGVAVAPLLGNRPALPEEYQQLDQAVRKDLERRRGSLMAQVEEAAAAARQAGFAAGERLADLDRQVAEAAVGKPFAEVVKAFDTFPALLEFLDRLKASTLASIDAFQGTGDSAPGAAGPDAGRGARLREVLLSFAVNCFIDNSETIVPPIIEESNPTFDNLFGRIDRRFSMGAYVSDHTMLKSGSVQAANGGYLILDMRNIINQPLVWETLKRVLKTKEVRPEDHGDAAGASLPQGMKAQPMPLDLKLVVTGEASVYNYLAAYDEDFWETFKVKADFDYQIRRNQDHLQAYGAFVCGATIKYKLLPFDAGAVAKVVEHAARMVGDQEKLSTRFGVIIDLLVEADHWARADAVVAGVVEARHVKKALDEKDYRSGLSEERLRDVISDGTIMVDVEGEAVGQINGLAVLGIGDVSFGKPVRITARTFLGRGGVINIEREAKLSGKTHDKGVLIIGGFLGWKYAQEAALTVSASIAFEQSYSGIDGDSASSTEVYAILSSLAGVPIKQGFAVTGSVNQKGEVQAIGGVNEKIEGFYDVCSAIGFTGKQGVLVPKQNVRNLMLREDIVDAVREGRFRIYAVGSIDEGIELLTGVPAGARGEDGKYPAGSMHFLVEKRLREYGESSRAASKGKTDSESAKDDPPKVADVPKPAEPPAPPDPR